jgi:xylulokinase
MEPNSGDLYLGLDLSTQSLDAVVIDLNDATESAFEVTLNFDSELPDYGTRNGFIYNAQTKSAVAPALMFAEALERVLEKLHSTQCPFERIRAVSVSAQQHGSVYWRRPPRLPLTAEASQQSLVVLLKEPDNAFALPQSPIWADASTTEECRAIEAAFPGGAMQLALATGSRAYERYTAAQVVKLAKDRPALYDEVQRIQVISAFMTSLLQGSWSPEDVADASGTLWLDLHALPPHWHDDAIRATEEAAGVCRGSLLSKLASAPVLSSTVSGLIAPYFCYRFGFQSDCVIVTGTGDNPSSAAGFGMRLNDVCVSLGTSDTAFGRTQSCQPQVYGHVFRSAIDSLAYTPILVFSNGSLTRERIRGPEHTWEDFDQALERTPAGNRGLVGFMTFVDEILPRLPAGVMRFARILESPGGSTATSEPTLEWLEPDEVESHDAVIRAVVEQRALAIRRYGERIGLPMPPRRVLLTGGASQSRGMQQVIADVLGAPVYVLERAKKVPGAETTVWNAAARGAALRAAYVQLGIEQEFSEWCSIRHPIRYRLVAEASQDAHDYYTNILLPAYARAEARLTEEFVRESSSKAAT